MAGTIKGITIEIGGDTSPLDKALSGVNKTARNLQSELREVERGLKLDPENTVLLEQKQKLLADSIANTATKLDTLKEAERQAQVQFADGKVSEEQYRALQREVIKTEQQLQNLEGQASKVNTVLSKDEAIGNLKNIGAAAGLAAAAVGVAFVGVANAAVGAADEIQRQADVTGLSAERLQELTYAGSNLGVELDTITGAQAKLTKSMAGATDETKGTGAAFKQLGVEVRDSTTGELRSASDVMAEAFTALNGIGNETERDALAMEIFGKSAMQLNPLIKAGGDELNRLSAEARNNGAVMSNEAVAGLDTFGDTMDNLKLSIMGGVGTALAGLMPQIQELISGLMQTPQWIAENQTMLILIAVALGTVLGLVIAFNVQQALLASGMTLWSAAAGVATGVTTGLATAFAFLTSPIGLIILAIGAVIAIGVLLYQHWDELKAKATELWAQLGATFAGIQKAITDTINTILAYVKEHWQTITTLFFNPVAGVIALLYTLNPKFRQWVTSAFNDIKATLSNWADLGIGMIDGIISGIEDAAGRLADAAIGAAQDALDSVKDFLGIQSPSKVFREQIGAQIGAGMALGIEDSMDAVNGAITGINTDIKLGVSTDTTRNAGAESNQIVVNVYDGVNGLKRELGRWGVRMP